MKILALDPSSSRTGFCAAHDERTLIECGVLSASGDACTRIGQMVDDVRALLKEHEPDAIVIEVPSGKTHRRMGKNVSGLPIYGMAAGAVWALCRDYAASRRRRGFAAELTTTCDNEWTRGTKKAHRQRCVEFDFPRQYDKRQDAGGDASDAIGLLQWFCRERMTRPEGVA